jgi:hypothetical protein
MTQSGLSIVLLLFYLLVPPHKAVNASGTTDSSPTVHQLDGALEQDSIIIKDTTIIHQQFPWSSNHPCELGNYHVQGVIPAMHDALAALSLTERLTNGLNRSKARSNYHGVDYSSNGKDYSAAIDISVRCLSEDQIRSLLDELSIQGFAGWYRAKGQDGWNGDHHIHAIWVASPLKPALNVQVNKWLSGKNGLTSDKDYNFWTPKPDAIEGIRSAFSKWNPN